MRECVCECECACACVLATWLSSAATFGAELLTQNTDKVSNLFSLRRTLPLPATAFIPRRIQKTGASENLDVVGGTKNTFDQMAPTALGSRARCATLGGAEHVAHAQ